MQTPTPFTRLKAAAQMKSLLGPCKYGCIGVLEIKDHQRPFLKVDVVLSATVKNDWWLEVKLGTELVTGND